MRKETLLDEWTNQCNTHLPSFIRITNIMKTTLVTLFVLCISIFLNDLGFFRAVSSFQYPLLLNRATRRSFRYNHNIGDEDDCQHLAVYSPPINGAIQRRIYGYTTTLAHSSDENADILLDTDHATTSVTGIGSGSSRRNFIQSLMVLPTVSSTAMVGVLSTPSILPAYANQIPLSTGPTLASATREIAGFDEKLGDDSSTRAMKNKAGDNTRISVYQIYPDASANLSPYAKPLDSSNFLKFNIFNNVKRSMTTTTNQNLMTQGGVIWLGEHHNSREDHDVQAFIIESIYNQRRNTNSKGKMAIGLEQVQVQYQNVLDAYIQGFISEEEMLSQCQWSTRWTWPFENYKSIFNLARRLKIPLIALNVDSEDLAKVEVDGFKGLDKAAIQKYIKDPQGFSDFARPASYRTYSAYVIEPSYELHKKMGILKSTISGQALDSDMSFRNFFSGRILWDEAMAGNAYQWTKENEGGIMVGLVGADHVKFEKGVVGRYQRLFDREPCNNGLNVAVLLNPTLIDTLPSGSLLSGAAPRVGPDASSPLTPNQITLQLRYLKDDIPSSSEYRNLPSSTGGVLPLADYIVVSQN